MPLFGYSLVYIILRREFMFEYFFLYYFHFFHIAIHVPRLSF